ncbi:hypothetical protein [Rufibacter aurantiacus]|uniref:hypothetical protein n=1 Tax=Rufibacter aurantiacus TaxID=2817374 RepID=UPI001B30665F|nr:hypothetical protein [Rufibacter aurantiacus]
MMLNNPESVTGKERSKVIEETFKKLIREDTYLHLNFVEEFKQYNAVEFSPEFSDKNSSPAGDKHSGIKYAETSSLGGAFAEQQGKEGWFCGEDFIEFRQPNWKSYLDYLNEKYGKTQTWTFFPYPCEDSRNRNCSALYGLVDIFNKMNMELAMEGFEEDDAVIRWKKRIALSD